MSAGKLSIIFVGLLFLPFLTSAQTTGRISAAARSPQHSMQCIYEVQIGARVYSGLHRGILNAGCDTSLIGKDLAVEFDKHEKHIDVVLPSGKKTMKLEIVALEEKQ